MKPINLLLFVLLVFVTSCSNDEKNPVKPAETVTTPTFSPAAGTYQRAQTVTISCEISEASIYYTTNGNDPTESSTIYSGAIMIDSTTTLKARAYKEGWTASKVASATFIITGTVATPTFSPAPGTYTSAQSITIICATSGADIYYTTNGSDPTESSTLYYRAITISSTTTLKARTYKSGWMASGVKSGTYTINDGSTAGTVTDIDGNVYQTVKIGNQWWMVEDLRVTHYRNGESIPNVTDDIEWTQLTTGANCYYDNNSSYATTYGALYNWYAVIDRRKLAPVGWHVPTDAEWKQLEMYLGMSQSAADEWGWRGTDEGGKLKETGTAHWYFPNEGATNSSDFTARPGGYRYGYDGHFCDMGNSATYWSTTEYNNYYAWFRKLGYYGSDVYRDYPNKPYGFSVRLVRD